MPNDDTVKLLRECSAGTEMALDSIKEVIDHAKEESLYQILDDYLNKHQTLQAEIREKLTLAHDREKAPNPFATAMSWSKIHLNLLMNSSSAEIAKLMRDGCSMGIKSLQQYLEQYPTASSDVKQITERLISIERDFHNALERYV